MLPVEFIVSRHAKGWAVGPPDNPYVLTRTRNEAMALARKAAANVTDGVAVIAPPVSAAEPRSFANRDD